MVVFLYNIPIVTRSQAEFYKPGRGTCGCLVVSGDEAGWDSAEVWAALTLVGGPDAVLRPREVPLLARISTNNALVELRAARIAATRHPSIEYYG